MQLSTALSRTRTGSQDLTFIRLWGTIQVEPNLSFSMQPRAVPTPPVPSSDRANSPWTKEHSRAAQLEGWDLWRVLGDAGPRLEIQRLDEAQKFESDAEALSWIYRKAMEGSTMHFHALQISLQASPAFAPPCVGIDITGGVLHSVWSDTPASILRIDYDLEGLDDSEVLTALPQDDGSTELAYVTLESADIIPGRLAAQRHALSNANEVADPRQSGLRP